MGYLWTMGQGVPLIKLITRRDYPADPLGLLVVIPGQSTRCHQLRGYRAAAVTYLPPVPLVTAPWPVCPMGRQGNTLSLSLSPAYSPITCLWD